MSEQIEGHEPPSDEEILNHVVSMMTNPRVPKSVVHAEFDGKLVHVMCAELPGTDTDDSETVYVWPMAVIMDDDLRHRIVLQEVEESGGENYDEGNREENAGGSAT